MREAVRTAEAVRIAAVAAVAGTDPAADSAAVGADIGVDNARAEVPSSGFAVRLSVGLRRRRLRRRSRHQ